MASKASKGARGPRARSELAEPAAEPPARDQLQPPRPPAGADSDSEVTVRAQGAKAPAGLLGINAGLIGAKGVATKLGCPELPPATLAWRRLTAELALQRCRPWAWPGSSSGLRPARDSSASRVLLDDVAGCVQGGLTAVLGPSGSSKTTLLNALALRSDVDAAVLVTGEMRIDGRTYTARDLKAIAGYVLQNTLFDASLTVQETLTYAAALRLPATAVQQRIERVNQVIVMLGLEGARHTLVGEPGRYGSGGECKRLSIAVELLPRPSILFLDEPTSGLDSVNALSLIRILKSMADEGGTTVVCTLHQPQAKIFDCLERLLLLRTGRVVYQGPAADAVSAFASVGYPLPADKPNPSDFLLELVTTTTEFNSAHVPLSAEADAVMISKYGKPNVDPETCCGAISDEAARQHRHPVYLPWHRQAGWIARLTAKQVLRRWHALAVQLLLAGIFGGLLGSAYIHVGWRTTQYAIDARQALLFFAIVNQGLRGAAATMLAFPMSRKLALQERAAGTYQASAFFFAKTTTDCAFGLLAPTLFAAIIYWSANLSQERSAWEQPLIFWGFMLLNYLATVSLSLAATTLCRGTTELAISLLPPLLDASRLFGGFFLAPAHLPPWFVWLDAISYIKYAYVGVSLNELRGRVLHCAPSELVAGACPVTRGEQTLAALGMERYSLGGCVAGLLIYIVVMRTIAYLAFRFLKT